MRLIEVKRISRLVDSDQLTRRERTSAPSLAFNAPPWSIDTESISAIPPRSRPTTFFSGFNNGIQHLQSVGIEASWTHAHRFRSGHIATPPCQTARKSDATSTANTGFYIALLNHGMRR